MSSRATAPVPRCTPPATASSAAGLVLSARSVNSSTIRYGRSELIAASRSGVSGRSSAAGSALMKTSGGTVSRASRAISIARAAHNWSSSGIRPARVAAANSASGNSMGDPAGPRASASTPTSVRVARSTIGWYRGNTARSASTRGMSAAGSSRGSHPARQSHCSMRAPPRRPSVPCRPSAWRGPS